MPSSFISFLNFLLSHFSELHKAKRSVTRHSSLILVIQAILVVAVLSVFFSPLLGVRNFSNFRTEEQSGVPRELKEEERLPRPRPRQLVKYACDRRGGIAKARRGFSSDRLP